ncbi:MAG: 2,3,4,5-tetrahydropyridine-2,6-dicarboxylate N-succinyltransferase [Woeseiaceae bacterium]
MTDLGAKIDAAYSKTKLDPDDKAAIQEAIRLLDRGERRVCEFDENKWKTNQWLKKALLLYFRVSGSEVIPSGPFSYYDKIPLKQWDGSEGVRIVPQALARYGCYIESGAILMPSYVNIGAYVGSGTLVDTWATVGSCAQIGRQVHLSGGVGIGGVLEPIQADPVIIEDHAFIGSRCIVVEGVHVQEGAVLGAGVVLTSSTPILDVRGSEVTSIRGVVPKNAVVIPGSRQKQFPAGHFDVPCALIIGERSASTDRKTGLTAALRDFDVAV